LGFFAIERKKKTLESSRVTFIWCPAAESDYELVLTMDPLYRLTSGALVAIKSYANVFSLWQPSLVPSSLMKG
jgi:hypothetical protein